MNIQRNRGLKISSERIYIMSPEKSCNYSLLVAIYEDIFVGFLIAKESVKSEIYAYFLNSLIDRLKIENLLKQTTIVADNASIHKSQFVNRIYSSQANFLFLPPYFPELNPIELCWSKLRREVRNDLLNRIFLKSKTITKNDC
jgi:transposase